LRARIIEKLKKKDSKRHILYVAADELKTKKEIMQFYKEYVEYIKEKVPEIVKEARLTAIPVQIVLKNQGFNLTDEEWLRKNIVVVVNNDIGKVLTMISDKTKKRWNDIFLTEEGKTLMAELQNN